jgi:hypothetical protein
MITSRAFYKSVAHALRRTALPLAAYYVVTLAVPVANGAAQSGSFGRHALLSFGFHRSASYWRVPSTPSWASAVAL